MLNPIRFLYSCLGVFLSLAIGCSHSIQLDPVLAKPDPQVLKPLPIRVGLTLTPEVQQATQVLHLRGKGQYRFPIGVALQQVFQPALTTVFEEIQMYKDLPRKGDDLAGLLSISDIHMFAIPAGKGFQGSAQVWISSTFTNAEGVMIWSTWAVGSTEVRETVGLFGQRGGNVLGKATAQALGEALENLIGQIQRSEGLAEYATSYASAKREEALTLRDLRARDIKKELKQLVLFHGQSLKMAIKYPSHWKATEWPSPEELNPPFPPSYQVHGGITPNGRHPLFSHAGVYIVKNFGFRNGSFFTPPKPDFKRLSDQEAVSLLANRVLRRASQRDELIAQRRFTQEGAVGVIIEMVFEGGPLKKDSGISYWFDAPVSPASRAYFVRVVQGDEWVNADFWATEDEFSFYRKTFDTMIETARFFEPDQ